MPNPRKILNHNKPRRPEFVPRVNIYPTPQGMGKSAAIAVSGGMRNCITKKAKVVMVFAAAPSQDEFLDKLSKVRGIDWSKVVAFHLDEYVDLPRGHPNSFEVYLKDHLFNKVDPKRVHFINGIKGTPRRMCKLYAQLIETEGGIDIACIGIGENGHIAFNEPGSNFNDEAAARITTLDEYSRQQQLRDYKNDPNPAKRYRTLKDVPKHAITLTIPTILSAKNIFVIVPGEQKAEAVENAIEGPIGPSCPASSLRTHPNVTFYLDKDSASLLQRRNS